MEGDCIKQLFIMNDINLNEHEYFSNEKKYDITDIKNICTNKMRFEEIVKKRYGNNVGKYVSELIIDDGHIRPNEMLNLFNFVNTKK